jgi:hypothetical protein
MSLISLHTQLFLTTFVHLLLGSPRGQDWSDTSPAPSAYCILLRAVLYHTVSLNQLGSSLLTSCLTS